MRGKRVNEELGKMRSAESPTLGHRGGFPAQVPNLLLATIHPEQRRAPTGCALSCFPIASPDGPGIWPAKRRSEVRTREGCVNSRGWDLSGNKASRRIRC